MKRIVAAAAILGLSVAGLSSSAQAGTRCENIKGRYFSVTRPYMSRVVRGSPIISMGFKTSLSRVQRGKNPTVREIGMAYKLVLKRCATRSDKAVCRRVAKQLRFGAVKTYNDHRDWARGKCQGRLKIK